MAKKRPGAVDLMNIASVGIQNSQDEKRFTPETLEQASLPQGKIHYLKNPDDLFLTPELLENRVLHTDATKNILKTDIQAEGIKEPLIVSIWNGQKVLLDGFTRLEVYRELGLTGPIPYRLVKPLDWTNNQEFIDWAIAYMDIIQDSRRAYTKLQIAYNVGKQYHALKNKHGGDRKSDDIKVQNVHLDPLEQIMAKFGISRRTVFNNYQFYLGCLKMDRKVRQLFLVGKESRVKRTMVMHLGKMIQDGQKTKPSYDVKDLERLVIASEQDKKNAAKELEPQKSRIQLVYSDDWGDQLWNTTKSMSFEEMKDSVEADMNKANALYFMLKAQFRDDEADRLRMELGF